MMNILPFICIALVMLLNLAAGNSIKGCKA